MRLGLVDGPGHHGPLMRAQLSALGHDVLYTRSHPRLFISDGTPPLEALLHDAVRRVSASAQHRLGFTTAHDFDLYTRVYGQLAARHLDGCDAAIGFSFVARESLRRTPFSILELPATHVERHEQIVDAEHEQAGLPRRSRLSRFTRERAVAEYHAADLVEVLSTYAKTTLVQKGVSADKIVVSPPGIDLTRFHPTEKPSQGFRVLCVGRVELQKGIRPLLRAIPAGAELRLIGAVGGEVRPLLGDREVVPPLSLADLAREYREADVLAFPTLSDGFGLVMLEAMASGIPVVASDRSGAPDVIRDGIDGFVVPAGDADALAERLAQLQRDPEQRREMGRAARARVEADYSEARYRERLAQLMTRISESKSRESAARPSPR